MSKSTKTGEKSFILPYINPSLTEAFKSDVESKPIRFPRELGEEHPFNFLEAEKTYYKIGITKASVDKHLDFIIAPGIYVNGPKQSINLINKFIKGTDFGNVVRKWFKEGLIKGNGFIEKDLKNWKLKIVNANTVYIKRDEKGEIEDFNQYIDNLNNFAQRKINSLGKENIVHLPIDEVGDCPYGFGMIYPAFLILDNLAKSEKDMHTLMNRKANNPIIAKLGTVEEPATQADIDDMGGRLEHLNNMHEWVFDHKVDFSVVDFGNLADKFTSILEHDTNMLFYTFQVPPVIMGSDETSTLGQAGKSSTQMDAFERRIQSLQALGERLIENEIFKPLLEMNGLKGDVELFWGQPSETKINERITRLTEMLKIFNLSPQLKVGIEKDVANLLGYEDVVKSLPTPEEAKAEADKLIKQETEKEFEPETSK